jgi:hypothetical protein
MKHWHTAAIEVGWFGSGEPFTELLAEIIGPQRAICH